MKITKKIIGLVLAIIMIVCTVPMASARLSDYDKNDTFQFGTYPQTEVKDASLIAKLNNKAPSWGSWVNYGYYNPDPDRGDLPVEGSWMRYIDISLNGEMYRGVRFSEYRHPLTSGGYGSRYQEDNGYYTKTIYWFKFEPINWRVLDPDTGFAISDIIIDAQAYNNTLYIDEELWEDGKTKFSHFNDASHTNYASDYETSSIRKWLNETFYNLAFTDSEKEEIAVTTLNNDGIWSDSPGYEVLNSNVTKDKIFILSVNEAENENYFEWWEKRLSYSSDYAKCQGLGFQSWDADAEDYETSYWWLRTPGDSSERSMMISTGGLEGTSRVTHVAGIRPAIYLKSHSHNYDSSSTTAPTCTNKGYTTYFCDCGASYIGNYVNKVSHIDNDGDKKCDYGCGYTFGSSTPDTSDDNCPCDCHAGGIKAFFFKIINFFQKLFGQNKVCACGVKH